MKTKILSILIIVLSISKPENLIAQNWSAVGTGTNNRVSAMTSFNGELYAGGWFTTAGGISSNYIAKWNGSTWSSLGQGVGGHVNALAVYNGELYAGGEFTSAGGMGSPAYNIAKWNGNAWSAVSGGTSGVVNALAVFNNELYIGGNFVFANGLVVSNLAKWNGTELATAGGINSYVTSLGVYNDELYVGGNFSNAGGTTAYNIARFNGTNWASVGAVAWASAPLVYAFSTLENDLIVGGNFYSSNYVAKWNQSAWSPLGIGTNNTVFSLATFNNELYAGGSFTQAGGVSANKIAKWNGVNWQAIGTGVNLPVYSFAEYNSELYVGGDFSNAGGVSATFIAKINSTITEINSIDRNDIDISLYPNPSTGEFSIANNSSTDIKEILIYNLGGQIIFKNQIHKGTVTFNLSDKATGFYFYKIEFENGTISYGKLTLQ